MIEYAQELDMKENQTPWDFFDEYRGTEFEGQWPSLKQMYHISVLRYGTRHCFTTLGKDGIHFTYQEAEEMIKKVSSRLTELGVGKDTHVGVSGKNSPQWAVAFLAVIYAGAVVVPLDNTLHEKELKYLTSFGDVEYFFGDLERLSYIKGDMKHVFSLEPSEDEEYVFDMNAEKKTAPLYEPQASDLAAIMFTSGTTGNPKGVMLTHENLVSCCYQAQSNMNIYHTDVFYAILPIHHAYTLQADFIESMSVGAELIFGKKLIINKILADMKEGHVTMFLAVPLLFNKMILALMDGVKKKGPIVYGFIKAMMGFSGFLRNVFHINIGKKMFRFLLSKLSLENNRICISGGGPLPESTTRQFHQLGLDFVQGYGLTETSPITHLNPTYAFVQASVGKICAGYQQKIVDPDSDGNGLIYLKGSCVMKGYYKNPEATSEVLSEDGWFNTGDVGHIDDKGYLYLTGRAKNVIVLDGGKNVFPEEIEDMFQLYGDLDQVCVVAYDKDKAMKSEGIRLLALPSLGLKEKCKNSVSAISSAINGIVEEVNHKLLNYKRITKVTVLDEPLETTSSKKIKRAVVQKKFRYMDDEEKKTDKKSEGK